MPKIQKDNIWDLVGSNYHSFLLTTYSFDFYFFVSVLGFLYDESYYDEAAGGLW